MRRMTAQEVEDTSFFSFGSESLQIAHSIALSARRESMHNEEADNLASSLETRKPETLLWLEAMGGRQQAKGKKQEE